MKKHDGIFYAHQLGAAFRIRPVCGALAFAAYMFIALLAAACQNSPGNLASADPDTALKNKIAQMLLVGFRGTELDGNPIYDDITQRGIGGVVLFDYDIPTGRGPRNIDGARGKALLTKLCADIQAAARDAGRAQLFIAIDQEGGRVNRLRSFPAFAESKSARDLAAAGNAAFKDTAEATARFLSELGVNINFAPCVDLDINPRNPIIGAYGRSFSADPDVVEQFAKIWIDAHKKYGVFSCPKHFPGHGSSRGDTHRGVVDVSATWSEGELAPYRRLIQWGQSSGKIPFVMTSHVFNKNIDPRYPATLSKATLTGILRERLGFTGLIVSDDLEMAAIKAEYNLETTLETAINAGVDILAFSNNGSAFNPALSQEVIDTVFHLVKTGRVTTGRIDASFNRIMALKRTL
jgi:beta-N-acetylhexosaminidase